MEQRRLLTNQIKRIKYGLLTLWKVRSDNLQLTFRPTNYLISPLSSMQLVENQSTANCSMQRDWFRQQGQQGIHYERRLVLVFPSDLSLSCLYLPHSMMVHTAISSEQIRGRSEFSSLPNSALVGGHSFVVALNTGLCFQISAPDNYLCLSMFAGRSDTASFPSAKFMMHACSCRW